MEVIESMVTALFICYGEHTGRRFQSESTLQDIEIGQICSISMSR